MRTIIQNAFIVNEGKVMIGSILVDDGNIVEIFDKESSACLSDENMPVELIDATGCFVLPGVIDDHVHFREPGLTHKADIDSESAAAAAGGVTSYMDMPNCVPQTTSLEALDEKLTLAHEKSHVNYSFFFGATNDNVGLFEKLDAHRIPGIKLFMGSSTGNMLVDKEQSLNTIFKTVAKMNIPVMAHCEDTAIINANMARAKAEYGDDPDVSLHSEIRSGEACFESTSLAVRLAVRHNARLHVAHLSTAKEVALIKEVNAGVKNIADKRITAEAVSGHLLFTADDHATLGAKIKINPAIKTSADRDALRHAVADGTIDIIATDHAPHLLSEKQGGCCKAASGMPMVQFSLVAMLGLVDEGILTIGRLVQLMCHNPAVLFGIRNRGFIRRGYKADLVIVRPSSPWSVTADCIRSKCGWSPVEGMTFSWRVERTICNGHTVFADGKVDMNYVGEELSFR
ncbi:MAG: dihydroorotase [Prevotella sp.]|nr:dihydroorotase [Prevotella sp.]MBO5155903.1 dihydroorotase [Prevotella sp.]